MINPYIEYINQQQAALATINRHHDEVRAVGRALSEMCTARRDAERILQLHHDTFNIFNNSRLMLSFLPTSHYTRNIEDEREVPKDLQSKEEFMSLFGDIYE